MFERWLEALRSVTAERERLARNVVDQLCSRALAVVLFGSRARGDNTPLSDWDLLAIIPSGQFSIEAIGIGQVTWLPLDKLEEVLESSMVILDAVLDGKLLCGSEGVFMEVRNRVLDYVRRKGLVRTGGGWFPTNVV